MLLIIGPISDRVGRRQVMRPVLVLSSVATVVLIVDIDVAPVAVIGLLGGLNLWTGALVQALGRRLSDPRVMIAAGMAAAVVGLAGHPGHSNGVGSPAPTRMISA